MSDILYTVWLSLACTPGSETFKKLLYKFSTPYEIFQADEESIASCISSKSRDYNSLIDKDTKRAESIVDFCERKSVGILTYFDKKFPDSLRKMPYSDSTSCQVRTLE